MRKFALGMALLAFVSAPVLADDSDYNKAVDLGQKAPDFSGIPAWNPVEKAEYDAVAEGREGRRGRAGVPGQPLPGGAGLRGSFDRLRQ